VTLDFSEPVRPLAARRFPSGGGEPVEAAPEAQDERVVVPVPDGVGKGTVVLSWRVVSADGHPVGGSHLFSIGPPTAAADAPVGGSARLAALGRGLLTLALVFGVGGAVFLCLVDRSPTPASTVRRLAIGAAIASPPLALLALGLQGLDLLGLAPGALLSVEPWSAALASPFAATAGLSGLAALAAIAALRAKEPVGGRLALAAWGLAAISFALFGHAANAAPRWLTAPCIAVHATAFIFWIGALPGLAERAVRPGAALAPTLRRFSAMAVPLVGILVLTGAVLTVVQVHHPSALLDTAYGRLLTAKLIAVVLLLLLAAFNRLRLTPRIERGSPGGPARFRRSVTTEIALGLLILVLASSFRLTPPPRALAAAPTEAYVHLHGPKVMADVTLTPGRAGTNPVEIAIVSVDGAPMDPLEVRISFADPARGLEPFRLDAVRKGEVWKAGPVTLPYDGDWTVRLDVLVSDFDRATLEATVTLGGP
jgi:copper transport protein